MIPNPLYPGEGKTSNKLLMGEGEDGSCQKLLTWQVLASMVAIFKEKNNSELVFFLYFLGVSISIQSQVLGHIMGTSRGVFIYAV